ncbi:MAG: PaaX family transcriptional regulator C-terminal domain-containing protein [Acidimicrobiales bacterium]
MASTRQPLDSRSLIASVLLGSHPPQLSGKRLVALGELFGIADGTTRVALSRMVRRGELSNTAGDYALQGALLARQRRQDESRRSPSTEQDQSEGAWEQWIVRDGRRSSKSRLELRSAARQLNLAELREGVWLRPANLDPQRLPDARLLMAKQAHRFDCLPDDASGLISKLFDTSGWAAGARRLIDELIEHESRIVDEPNETIPTSFFTATAVVRHILFDPLLPASLLPADWPGGQLRSAYAEQEKLLQGALAKFFSGVS